MTCRSCITRIPYGTLISTVMCLIGVGIFCKTMYIALSVTFIMLDKVFHQRLIWIETLQIIFVVIGATMAGVGLMIFIIGCLTTGATRHKVYKSWITRLSGRVSCIVFLIITYILNIIWILIFCFLSIMTFVFTVLWNLCANSDIENHVSCIELKQFKFLFPRDTHEEHMNICQPFEIKVLCKDTVETGEIMLILSTVSCLLVILSLIHYLMCLTSNYAHIRDHEKFREVRNNQQMQTFDYNYKIDSKETL